MQHKNYRRSSSTHKDAHIQPTVLSKASDNTICVLYSQKLLCTIHNTHTHTNAPF